MEDLNGYVGNKTKRYERMMGSEGEKMINKNSERIIELCIDNDLVIATTKIYHKNHTNLSYEYTKEEHNKKEKSIITF